MKSHFPRILPGLAALLALSLVIASCSLPVPIISRNTLFKPYTRSAPSVSPDGKHVVYTALDGDVRNLYIRTVGADDDTVLTNVKKGASYFFWARNSKMVVFSQSTAEGLEFFVVDVATGAIRPLLPYGKGVPKDAAVEVVAVSIKRPDEIAIMVNARDPSIFDLHLVNVRTGDMKLLAEGKSNLLRWYVDPEFALRGYLLSEPDGGQSFWKYQDGRFTRELTWHLLDDSSWPLAFPAKAHSCLMFDSRGAKTLGVLRYNLDTGDTTVLARDPQYDIRKIMVDSEWENVDAVFIQGDTSRWVAVDSGISPKLKFLQSKFHGEVEIYNRSADRKVWTVGELSDVAPPVYYLYYADEMRLSRLYSASDELAGKPFARMKVIQFTARDGMPIHGYLTTPRRGRGPWPTVLLVHGGPWLRDAWGFNPEAQWLANRGYAVLQVNFRGSMGYDKAYLNAGNRQWGLGMQTDLADGAAWAVKAGVAKAGAVAIMGGSYGGYAAVSGAITTPNSYVAAVAVNPFLDLTDYLSIIPPTWEAYRTNLEQRVGRVPRYESGLKEGQVKDSTDWTDADRAEIQRLKAVSPYYHAEKVSIPLLIAQGKRDALARPAVAQKFVDRLKKLGKNVELVLYDDSSHMLQTEDRQDFYFRAELFLASYLGGRVEK